MKKGKHFMRKDEVIMKQKLQKSGNFAADLDSLRALKRIKKSHYWTKNLATDKHKGKS